MDHLGSQQSDGMMPPSNAPQANSMTGQHSQQRMQQPQMMAPSGGGGVETSNQGNNTIGSGNNTNATNSSAMTAPLMMNLMTNPALAAAAAASPLFPPAAMLSNPGAYLAMPEAFAMSGAMNSQQQQQAMMKNGNNSGSNHQQTGLVQMTPGMNMMNTSGNGFDGSSNNTHSSNTQQQQQQQQHQHQPTPIMPSLAPLAPYNLTGVAGNTQQAGVGMMNSFHAIATTPTAAAVAAAAANEKDKKGRANRADLTPEEKAKQNRDRNREHARSTRLRKKAYVQKLKELVECLHAERTEEVRQRRVAIQHLSEKQNVRRSVVHNFLRYHTNFETETRKWATLLEDDFWLKQPVTPYRCFRRAEIEQECRISRGIESIVNDSASVAVMIEGIGSRSQRWMQIKREEFTLLESAHRGSNKKMPRCIQRQDSRLQHAVSSLSSSSGGSSNQFSSSGEDSRKRAEKPAATRATTKPDPNNSGDAAKVSSSSGSSNEMRNNKMQNSSSPSEGASEGYHDYHAKPLPDPKLNDSEQDESPEESNVSSNGDTNEESNGSSNGVTKRVSTDSSSGEDSTGAVVDPHAAKKRKLDHNQSGGRSVNTTEDRSVNLPANIAKTGGIGHSVRADQIPARNGSVRLNMAPAVVLPPFAGIGKKRSSVPRAPAGVGIIPSTSNTTHGHEAAVVSADAADSSSRSRSAKIPQIRAQYHMNEDDMILMDDVLMCSFVYRSHNAVLCGALSECVMPGMLRAHFSERNKLQSLELVYDAMGFMQQLERASGNEGTAQIIPGSLEMALTPSTTDALVITLAKPPYLIVNVNEVWTRTTGYTQMEVEGREYLALLEGEGTVAAASERPGKPRHKLEDVADGKCACSTNIHYDKEGRDFIEFVCSFPLTNAADEVTHLLHVSKELPSPQEASTSLGLDVSSS